MLIVNFKLKLDFKEILSMKKIFVFLLIFISNLNAQNLKKYNLSFDSPAADSWGSMVCGNGDVSANVWIDNDGILQFYIGKTDARDNISKLLKITQVSLECFPAIFKDANVYHQEFDLATASFRVKTSKGNLLFWVDANSPQIFIEIDSQTPITSTVTTHVWRRNAYENSASGFPFKTVVEADSLVKARKNDILLYHHNLQTNLFDHTIDLFQLSKNEVKNPLKNRVFGIHLFGQNLIATSDSTLVSTKPSNKIRIRTTVLTQKATSTAAWQKSVLAISEKNATVSSRLFFTKHQDFWKKFWNRSYIQITSKNAKESDTLYHINRAYLYNRYVMYLAAKGDAPLQFNGSTWLVDTKNDTIVMHKSRKIIGQNADFRVWDELILWQNMRLPYWTYMQAGDKEAMNSLLDFYTDTVYPRMKDFTQKILGKKGVVFTESTMLWGTVDPAIYGWDRKGRQPEYFENMWHQYHYICGLELVNMLLDYYEYTENEGYLKNKILPIAKDLLAFYQDNYQIDENGKMKIFPARTIETFLESTNPTPDIAGLKFVLDRLSKISIKLNDEALQNQCKTLLAIVPEIPIRKEKDGNIILPAEKVGRQINVEQPDLYAVYPFRLYTLATPLLKTGQYTFEHPTVFPTNQDQTYMMPHIKIKNSVAYRDIFSWHQTGVQAAYLGLTDYAKETLVRSALSNDKRFRFPSFYGPNYDYVPDGDHIAMINATLQSMVLQSENGKIFVLPAWPKNWDLSFKLHGFKNTVVEGQFSNGKMLKIKTSPKKKNIRVLVL